MEATNIKDILFKEPKHSEQYAKLLELQNELKGKQRINEHIQDIRNRIVSKMLESENVEALANFEKMKKKVN